ncbi:MAG: hypothetical protein R3321_11915 [Nitrososphaeraceae archaeon]|nr:hypothetical protein [Nitrososphaeraceae archaeon]
MKDDDKEILHLLIARLHARESANLAFLTISSSASLVFLGIVLIDNFNEESFWFIPIFGIIFPVFGLLYFEITYRTIQNYDQCQIRKLLLEDKNDKEKKRIKDIILYNKHRTKRVLFSRLLLFTSIFAWLVTTPIIIKNEFSLCLSIVGIILSVITIGWLLRTDKLPNKD